MIFSADIPEILSGAGTAPFLDKPVQSAHGNIRCNKNFYHFFIPTPALPVSGSKGLISAVGTATTAPLGYIFII
jgi:hypothetical protein